MNAVDISQEADVVSDAQEVLAHHAKSFRLASLFLPKDRSNDAAVIYRFCRLVDDAVDEAESSLEAHQNIEQITQELEGRCEARMEIASFIAVARRLGISLDTADALMKGVISDLGRVRVQNDTELAVYSYRVAGVVGRMMCGVLGVTSPKAIPHAIDLGIAMQITNICRDVLEDAGRDRVYLPNNRLQEHGVRDSDLLENRVSADQISSVVTELLHLAEISYRRAYAGMHYIPFRTRVAILIASRVYRSIGLKLHQKHGANPMHGRTMVSTAGKMWQVFLGLLDAVNPVTFGWFRLKVEPSPFYEDWEELNV